MTENLNLNPLLTFTGLQFILKKQICKIDSRPANIKEIIERNTCIK
jgi:hypothetical protein